MSAATDEYVICITSMAGYGEFDNVVFRRGDGVPADHPLVKANPQYFVPAGTPENLWPNRDMDKSIALLEEQDRIQQEEKRRRFEAACRANPVTLAIGDVAKLKEDLLWHIDGQPALVRKGSVVLLSEELYQANPEKFTVVKSKT